MDVYIRLDLRPITMATMMKHIVQENSGHPLLRIEDNKNMDYCIDIHLVIRYLLELALPCTKLLWADKQQIL